MKRGSILIVVLVLLTAFSIFTTGLHANFLNTITGNSLSLVTGNMVDVTGGVIKELLMGESCLRDADCLSGECQLSGNERKCWDPVPTPERAGNRAVGVACAAGNECTTGYCNPSSDKCAKRSRGMTCVSSVQCISGKCSNGICGKKAGENCNRPNSEDSNCLSGRCGADSKCRKSDDGNIALCAATNDCQTGLKCNKYRCYDLSTLKSRNEDCTFDSECVSSNCDNNNKCAYSAGGVGLCKTHTDCTDGFFCESYNKRCTAKVAIGGLCDDSSQCPGPNVNHNPNSCYKKESINQFGICGLKEGQQCANGFVCLSKTCTNNQRCAKSEAGEYCLKNSDCTTNNCNSNNMKCVAGTQLSTPSSVMQATPIQGTFTCTSWKDCTSTQYCAQNGVCAADRRQITDRDCAGNYQTKIGKGETCKTSMAFSLGNDADLKYFLRSGCTANSQCQLTISGSQIYNYCRKDGFCDARLFSDGRGCNTKANLCAIDERCNAATNKCVLKNPDGAACNSDNECISTFCDPATHKCAPLVGVGEQVNAEDDLDRLKTAINNALNNLLPRIQAVVSSHDIPTTGLVTLSEWRTEITSMDGRMQSIEDQICAESIRHPEIENEGFPCVQQSTIRQAQLPARRSIFQSFFPNIRQGVLNP